MSFTEAIRSAFSKYAKFDGRARRSEYWYFTLFISLVNMAVLALACAYNQAILGAILLTLFVLVMFLPSLAVTVRRLHDVNKSGWCILIAMIPIVGTILLLVWQCSRGTLGSNRFGDDPII
jgi:uncharacterized membrane protein YhaH (DUF805 family)